MRFMNKPVAIACLFLFGMTGMALAQQGNAPPSNAATEIKGGSDVNLSPQQMLDKARQAIPEMEKSRGLVAGQLAEAKKKRDVVKALCLDDKVKQIKLASDTAKDRVVALTSAVSQSDGDRSKHEFTVIQVLRERIQTLVAEAQQCIGEETGFVGNSEVIVEVDPGIPNADSAGFPEDPLVSDPPLLSSPTL